MSKIIVFDLDGTLALDEHRVHHLRGQEKNWDAYFAACPGDEPNAPIVQVYDNLIGAPGARVEIWTGRIDTYLEATLQWIEEHLIAHPDFLQMRRADDRTNDDELKRAWLSTARANGHEVVLAFEDRKRVVEMWRAEGVICAQVAPGEF